MPPRVSPGRVSFFLEHTGSGAFGGRPPFEDNSALRHRPHGWWIMFGFRRWGVVTLGQDLLASPRPLWYAVSRMLKGSRVRFGLRCFFRGACAAETTLKKYVF